jgi:O-antigen biosynthesis protein
VPIANVDLLDPLLSPALAGLFRSPHRLGKPSGWWGHVPFAFWVVEASRPSLLVELGTHHGVSYAAFCDAVQHRQLPTRCFAVDSWRGDAHAGLFDESVYRDLKTFNDAHFGAFSELIRADFDTAVGHFADGSIDLLHIDGFHTYEAVRHDYETWRPKLSSRAVVLFHDTNVRRDDFGVHRLFGELAARFPHFEFLHGHGLGLIAHGQDVSAAITQLCAASLTERCETIRDRFAAVGARWQGVANEQEMERSFSQQVTTLVAHHARVLEERDAAHAAAVQTQVELARAQALQRAAKQPDPRLLGERDEALRSVHHLQSEVRRVTQGFVLLERGLLEAHHIIAQQAEGNERLTRSLRDAERVASHLIPALVAPPVAGAASPPPGLLQRLRRRLTGATDTPPLPTDTDVVRASPFFDGAWYLATYSDVAAAGADAAEHYALFGGRSEDRDPGPWFSTRTYLQDNPDVAQRELNALAHYETHGRRENRAFPMRSLTPPPVPEAPTPVVVDTKRAFREQSQQELTAFLDSGRHLVLPTVETPRVSVVIVLHNQAELTFKCLESLVEALDAPCEIVLVDNASSDRTVDLLTRVEGVRLLPQSENLHFLRAANIGAAQARGEHLLFLNNDAQLKPGSVSAALALLDERARVGAVGGKVVLLDGRLQEAGSIIWSDGSCLGHGRGRDPGEAEFQFRREVDYCSGAFLMVRRSLFESLNGLDPAYVPAYYEETDLCMRIRRAGHSVVYDPRVEILHYEFGSADTQQTATSLMEAHRDVFVARHAQVLAAEHWPQGTRSLEARQRSGGQARILVIDDRIPVPSLGSGFPRARQLVHSLHEGGAFVSHYPVACPVVDFDESYAVLPREVEIVAGLGITGLAQFLRERAGFYHAVIVSRPHNMDRFLLACREAPAFLATTRLVYDAEAIFATREALRDEILGMASSPEDREVELTRELRMAEAAHCVLTVSDAEARRFRSAGCQDVRVLGHGIAAQPTPRAHAERRNLLFVGRLAEDGSPNADSVRWFVCEVMPRLDQRIGDGYSLDIVGSHSEGLVSALGSQRVTFHGRIEDIRDFYDRARVFVAPTRFSAGIPIKVQEAAAHGLPVVASELVAGQLGWGAGGELLSAPSADAFAEACARLYLDETLWNQTRQAALAAVARDCAPGTFQGVVQAVLNDVFNEVPGQTPAVSPALERSDLARAAETWSVSPVQRQEIQGMNWMAHPRVIARLNHKATGDEGKDVYIHLKDTLTGLGWRLPLARVASLGCGFGALERGFASIQMATHIDGYDIADGAITGARAAATAEGLDNIHYHVADLERLELPEASYDLIFGFQSVHHINDLDRLCRMVRRALRPGGVFHLHEYVGPDRFQWTDAQLSHMNAFLLTLPERYHRLPNGIVRGPRERPLAADVIACDPTEAVRSSQIVATVERHFKVLARHDLGGALLHIGLSDIAQNFDPGNPVDMAHLNRFFALEDRLMAEGVIGSDFMVLTAVKTQ